MRTAELVRTRKSFEFGLPFLNARKSFRRDGREAEGAPLLREYRANNSIEGSNPSLSAIIGR